MHAPEARAGLPNEVLGKYFPVQPRPPTETPRVFEEVAWMVTDQFGRDHYCSVTDAYVFARDSSLMVLP